MFQGSLYKGITPVLLGILPVAALSFLGYDIGLRAVKSFNGQEQDKSKELTPVEYMMAGCMAALPPALITIPGERIKILLQLDTSATVFGLTRQLIQEGGGGFVGGMRGLFKGSVITLIRDIPAYALWFGTYEVAKARFSKRGYVNEKGEASLAAILTAGSLAGVVQWTACLPLDTIKTTYQSNLDASLPASKNNGSHSSLTQVIRQLYRQQGLRAFYRGYIPAVLRAIPANGVSWLATETALSYIQQWNLIN